MTGSDPHIHAERRGVLGLLTLRRPEMLNALTLGMVRALDAALAGWAADDGIVTVAIRGEGARGFCAGGDIQAWVTAGAPAALAFLRAEYRLNARIAAFPKPFVALMHGVTMGGGAGLSIHAPWRLADPGLVFAMPETAIGFVPDIGSSYFLPRCPGAVGMYLALTAARIGMDDARDAGLVTHGVAATSFDLLLERLAAGNAVAQAIPDLVLPPRVGPLAPQRARLDTLFAAPSVEGVLERLARDGTGFARAAADAIRANAPTSLKLAHILLRRGAGLSLGECLRQEYRAAARLMARPDLAEGVRAALIDKDRKPRWHPAALAALPGEEIAALAAPLEGEEPAF